MINVNERDKKLYVETAEVLRGAERRLFMARVVRSLGYGSQSYAEREWGWNRRTIRKGTRELDSGIRCIDNFSARGRKRAEERLPNLLEDIRAIADSQSQTDPTFRTSRLYTRISAAEVHRQLIALKGYTVEELPCRATIGKKLNEMGYRLRQVLKSKPEKNEQRPMLSSSV